MYLTQRLEIVGLENSGSISVLKAVLKFGDGNYYICPFATTKDGTIATKSITVNVDGTQTSQQQK